MLKTRITKKRLRRKVLIAIGVAVGAIVAIRIAAQLDMNRERRARRYLGDRLYTEVQGDGDPVVFIAGLQGSTRYWGKTFDGLASSRRVILIDALGFGRSPWPEDSRYTLDDHIGALRRTLVALGVTRNVTIVAHSFGTILAAHYAARYPLEVARLVLLGVPVFASAEEGRVRIRAISLLAAMFTFNRPLAIASCTAMCATRPLLRRILPALQPDLPPDVVADSVLHDLPAIDGAIFNVLLKHPNAAQRRGVGSRTVLVHGRQDSVTPFADVERLARSTGASLIAVDGNHHAYTSTTAALIKQLIIEKEMPS